MHTGTWMSQWHQTQHEEVSHIIVERLPHRISQIRVRWTEIQDVATHPSDKEWHTHKMDTHSDNLRGTYATT